MSYQEVYNELNKKASNEQIKKLASIIGMKKQESLKKEASVKKLAGLLKMKKKATGQTSVVQNKSVEPKLPTDITSSVQKAPNSQYKVMKDKIKTNTPSYIKSYFKDKVSKSLQNWQKGLKYQGRLKSPY